MPTITYTQDAYDRALLRHVAAAKTLAAVRVQLDAALDELDQAEADLAAQEAYPGISAWAHAESYQPGGVNEGRTCGLLPCCKVHGDQARRF